MEPSSSTTDADRRSAYESDSLLSQNNSDAAGDSVSDNILDHWSPYSDSHQSPLPPQTPSGNESSSGLAPWPLTLLNSLVSQAIRTEDQTLFEELRPYLQRNDTVVRDFCGQTRQLIEYYSVLGRRHELSSYVNGYHTARGRRHELIRIVCNYENLVIRLQKLSDDLSATATGVSMDYQSDSSQELDVRSDWSSTAILQPLYVLLELDSLEPLPGDISPAIATDEQMDYLSESDQ